MSYDTETALLDYGPNPTLQILITKKRRQRAQKHLTRPRKLCRRCVWTLSMLSWSKVKIHGHSMHMTNTNLSCVVWGNHAATTTIMSFDGLPWVTWHSKGCPLHLQHPFTLRLSCLVSNIDLTQPLFFCVAQLLIYDVLTRIWTWVVAVTTRRPNH